MKRLISKIADCLFNITAGSVLISLFENYNHSIYISIISLLFSIILTLIANQIEE